MTSDDFWDSFPMFAVGVLMILAAILMGFAGCDHAPSYTPKVMIFTASWCSSCPTYDDIAQLVDAYPNVDLRWYDIDDSPDAAAEFHVKQVPRFFLCDDRTCRTTTSFDELRGWIRELPN